jgi:hypothetical protein
MEMVEYYTHNSPLIIDAQLATTQWKNCLNHSTCSSVYQRGLLMACPVGSEA